MLLYDWQARARYSFWAIRWYWIVGDGFDHAYHVRVDLLLTLDAETAGLRLIVLVWDTALLGLDGMNRASKRRGNERQFLVAMHALKCRMCARSRLDMI